MPISAKTKRKKAEPTLNALNLSHTSKQQHPSDYTRNSSPRETDLLHQTLASAVLWRTRRGEQPVASQDTIRIFAGCRRDRRAVNVRGANQWAGRSKRQGDPGNVGAAISTCPCLCRGARDAVHDKVRAHCARAGADGGRGAIEAAVHLLRAVVGGRECQSLIR